jgi:hypothetical protein
LREKQTQQDELIGREAARANFEIAAKIVRKSPGEHEFKLFADA